MIVFVLCVIALELAAVVALLVRVQTVLQKPVPHANGGVL